MKPYSLLNEAPTTGLFSGKKTRAALGGLVLLSGLAGCSPLRLLQPGQRLLSRVKVEGIDKADPERLQALTQQKPNSTFPLPKLAIYQLGRKFYNPQKLQSKLEEDRTHYTQLIQAAGTDSVKVGKLLTKRDRHMRRHQLALDKGNAIMRLGEAPVIYDSALTRASVAQMATFLKSKGFFRSSVSATDTVPTTLFSPFRIFTLRSPFHTEPRRVTVVYRVTEDQPFRYSQLDYDIQDTAVARRVLLSLPESRLHVGDQYDEEAIGNERGRIENLLKNQGFYDFRSQYITLEADTSFAPTTVRLRTIISKPARGEQHRLYTVRRVNFLADAGLVRFGQQRDTLVRNSVNYLAYQHKFSTRTLDNKILVRPGEPYSLQNTQLTQRQLSNLDMFRFSTVTYRRVRGEEAPTDSTSGLLDATINASPAKKYQETIEFGGTYVARLLGPFSNVRLKVRNVFGGAELLEFGVRAGLEGQLNALDNQPQLTTQLGANVNLVVPQFLVPWRANRFLMRYNPRTRINGSYTYVNRPEYTRTNIEATYDYIWQRSEFHQYVLTPFDLSVIRTPDITTAYYNDLQLLAQSQNTPLLRSFDNLFVPSVSATSLYNTNDFNETRDGHYLRLFAEVGGLTRSLYQNQPVVVSAKPSRDDRLKTYDFAKFTADYRRYHKLTPQTYFVYRLSAGVVRSITPTTTETRDADGQIVPGSRKTQQLVPYDKYLFAGGSSSVRAWKPRRLGTGSSTQYKRDSLGNETSARNYDLEQPGELLLEGNVEYRFPIYSFIKGALFTDFGNVWSLQNDPQRPGAQFKVNEFYRQFAVGSGFGVRFDFSFLILRLDVATKVYDPTAPGNKWAIRRISFNENQTAFNLGIGYPF